MIVRENCLLADNSHEISYLIYLENKKDIAELVICCSRDWRFKGFKSTFGIIRSNFNEYLNLTSYTLEHLHLSITQITLNFIMP